MQFPLAQLCTEPQVEQTGQQQNRLLSYFHPFIVGRGFLQESQDSPISKPLLITAKRHE